MLINDVFYSISGEVGVIPQGAITWFVRFQQCNLRCSWCDTPQGLERCSDTSTIAMPKQINALIPYGANVILTGGEPLLQDTQELKTLFGLLKLKHCTVQVETNGSIRAFLPCPHIFDYKTPSSGMSSRMMADTYFLENALCENTWIKFVAKHNIDLDFTIDKINQFNTILPGLGMASIAISVESGAGIMNAIHKFRTNFPTLMSKIVFNFQLHKHFNLK